MSEFTTWKMRLSKGLFYTPQQQAMLRKKRGPVQPNVHCKAAAVPGGAAQDGAVCAESRMPVASSTHHSSTRAARSFGVGDSGGPAPLLSSPQLREPLQEAFEPL